ncbi:MAG TPA: PDDEXK nuclease domain-containing protein [Candidatus Kapabacteria bacterium]|nr:PDDEXK nuclease domain-containing protein [Candidatus Kapabacteria bacterium]HPO62615.1 PDDEXK nuclease domain-containing protein [Candidatus Kapabacteria bacterium]
MKDVLKANSEYNTLLSDLKQKIINAQIKASVRVNSELILLYWELGKAIVMKQNEANWGDGLIKQLSKDLIAEFPHTKGFSERNLKYIRQWFKFYNQDIQIGQQVVAQIPKELQQKFDTKIRQQVVAQNKLGFIDILSLVPWGHHIQIISTCQDLDSALFYILSTIENSWSRSVLVHQIESKLFERQGKSINNFEITLPKPESALANELLKNPYSFEFLNLTKEVKENDLQNALLDNITKFLLELGYGFAFVGKQKLLTIGGSDFYVDLVFYHTKLHCYFIVELKIDEFKPEYSGKLNFYLNAFNGEIKSPKDSPTIGLLLCRKANKLIAEYSLKKINNPIGISEYILNDELPEELFKELPSIEEIERELELNINSFNLIK